MPKINQKSIEQKIIDDLNGPDILSIPREYLGYSSLGHHCARCLWYDFRWVTKKYIPGKKQRLFNRGHDEEKIIGRELDTIEAELLKDQYEVIGFEGHVKGHVDGSIIYPPWFDEEVLAEIKTYNLARFKALVKKGVRLSDPAYYSQAQSYMGKMGLRIAIFIATCKNDDERYVEIIEFDESEFNKLERKSEEIVMSDSPPERVGSGLPTWYECRVGMCDHALTCFNKQDPARNCRTCFYGTIIENGGWKCGSTETSIGLLTKEEQLVGCPAWKVIESLK